MAKKKSRYKEKAEPREPSSTEAIASLEAYFRHKDLSQLLRICAALSCYDYFSPFTDPRALKNYINYPKLRSLLAAVLRSGASLTSSNYVTRGGLGKALNDAIDAGYDSTSLDSALKLNGKPGVELEFHRFFARMGNIQILHREHNTIVWCGRALAMLERMPEAKRGWLSPQMQEITSRIAPQIKTILGISVRDLVLVHAALLLLHRQTYAKYLSLAGHLPERELLSLLLDTILDLSYSSGPFDISPAKVGNLNQRLITPQDAEIYFRLFSLNIEAHRELLGLPVYNYGHPAWQLLPFDRFPIVRTCGSEYIIPSLTMFAKSFPYVVDYTLLDEFGKVGFEKDYSAFRGAMQEIYLRALVEARLENCMCIPERAYGKEHRHGPDLTLIEGDHLIVVESKSRRMLVPTVSLMSDEFLDENLKEAYDALAKLPRKIEELYSALPEYSDMQRHIDGTKSRQPICVIVLSDLVFSLSEIVRLQALQDPEHPVRDFPYPFCIVSLDTFEKAVEIAGSSGPSLAELFEEHWQVSGIFNPSSHVADMFKARPLPNSKSRFATAFLREAWAMKEADVSSVLPLEAGVPDELG